MRKRKLRLLCTYGVPIPLIFSRYIHATAKSLQAMGLMAERSIILHGCTTLTKVAQDEKLRFRLERLGERL